MTEIDAMVEEIVAALRELALEAFHFAADEEALDDQLDPLVAKAKERIADAIRPT